MNRTVRFYRFTAVLLGLIMILTIALTVMPMTVFSAEYTDGIYTYETYEGKAKIVKCDVSA